jgi:benzoyl-CoA reductase/2-hydroxyglutaryl-CoA dehydratase subunit BcrC/BadD/HgdB
MFMKAMEKIRKHLRNRPVELTEMQTKGKKGVAHFIGDYLPTEIIHAAGAAPVGLVHGGDPAAMDASSSAIFRYICPFARSQYGYHLLKENEYFMMFDLLATPITCAHLRRMAEVYEFYTDKPIFKLGIPMQSDGKRATDYVRKSLVRFIERMEDLTGNKVTEKKLIDAIRLYRKMRELLKQISELRKSQQPPITTKEFFRLNHAAHLADPVVLVDLLEELYTELKGKEGPKLKGPRLLITGPNIAMGDNKVMDLIEKAGGQVVIEDIAEGVLYYWENVSSEGDPLDALVDRYIMKRSNFAVIRPNMDRHFDFIMTLAKDFSVAGIIWYQLRLCETYDIESYYFAKYLKEGKTHLPMLKLESEYDLADLGPLRTRIETFIETI